MPRTTLTARQQQAYELHLSEPELSVAEIAGRLRIKPTTTGTYIRTARSWYARQEREAKVAADLLSPEQRAQADIAAERRMTPGEVRAIKKELKDPVNADAVTALRDLSDRAFLRKALTIRDMMADEIITRANTEGGLENERIQNMAVVAGIFQDKIGILQGKPSATIQVDVRHHIEDLIKEAIRVGESRGDRILVNEASHAVTVHPSPDAPIVRRAKSIGQGPIDADVL